MRYEKTKCIVLDAAPSGESDKSLLLCTPDFGKITAVAPGALKGGARLSSALEPFRESRISLWGRAHSFKNRITSAMVEESFFGLASSSERMLQAFECARIYAALTPYFEADVAKYSLMRRALELLSRSENPRYDTTCQSRVAAPTIGRTITLGFALRMLKISGYDFAQFNIFNGASR
ncbi:MAG: recombination protein O N-terminal domain-containing protein, partial [Endomicrobiia bacterium]|nr:recombination protein O N-terminal domain-containing protein [Endomicrobiia bacterium]